MNDFLQSLRNGQAEKPRTPKTRKNSDNSYQYTNNSKFNSYGGGGYQNIRNNQMKRPHSQGIPQQGGNQIPAEDANIALLADVLDNLASHVETLVKSQKYMVNSQERTAEMLERHTIAIERIANHLNLFPDIKTGTKTDMAVDTSTDKAPGPQVEMNAKPVFENHYVTSRESKKSMEDNLEDNLGNSWAEPIATPAVEEGILVKPSVQNIKTGKPVLRKRKKVVAKEIITPKTKITAAKSPDLVKTKLMSRDAVMDIIQSMREEGATFEQVAKRLVELEQPTFSGRGEWHAQTIHRLCSKK